VDAKIPDVRTRVRDLAGSLTRRECPWPSPRPEKKFHITWARQRVKMVGPLPKAEAARQSLVLGSSVGAGRPFAGGSDGRRVAHPVMAHGSLRRFYKLRRGSPSLRPGKGASGGLVQEPEAHGSRGCNQSNQQGPGRIAATTRALVFIESRRSPVIVGLVVIRCNRVSAEYQGHDAQDRPGRASRPALKKAECHRSLFAFPDDPTRNVHGAPAPLRM